MSGFSIIVGNGKGGVGFFNNEEGISQGVWSLGFEGFERQRRVPRAE